MRVSIDIPEELYHQVRSLAEFSTCLLKRSSSPQ